MTQEVKPVLVIPTSDTTVLIVELPTEKPEDIYAEMEAEQS
jgi:hypothetical protein